MNDWARLIILVILLIAIPLTVYLVKTQKILKSKASNPVYNAFEVTGPDGSPLPHEDRGQVRIYSTNDLNVNLRIRDLDPLGY